jgi:hypothetical protein
MEIIAMIGLILGVSLRLVQQYEREMQFMGSLQYAKRFLAVEMETPR